MIYKVNHYACHFYCPILASAMLTESMQFLTAAACLVLADMTARRVWLLVFTLAFLTNRQTKNPVDTFRDTSGSEDKLKRTAATHLLFMKVAEVSSRIGTREQARS